MSAYPVRDSAHEEACLVQQSHDPTLLQLHQITNNLVVEVLHLQTKVWVM